MAKRAPHAVHCKAHQPPKSTINPVNMFCHRHNHARPHQLMGVPMSQPQSPTCFPVSLSLSKSCSSCFSFNSGALFCSQLFCCHLCSQLSDLLCSSPLLFGLLLSSCSLCCSLLSSCFGCCLPGCFLSCQLPCSCFDFAPLMLFLPGLKHQLID